MRKVITIALLSLLTSTLFSCTKSDLSDGSILCVTQVKSTVNIQVIVEPKPHVRFCKLVVEFGEKKIQHDLIFYPGETEIKKTFDEKAMLTKYYVVSLLRYHQ